MNKAVFIPFFFFTLISVLSQDIHLKVNLTESAPIVFPDEDGNALGFCPEILNSIAKQEGWELEYVHDTWRNSLRNLEEGKIDIMMSIARSGFVFGSDALVVNIKQMQKEYTLFKRKRSSISLFLFGSWCSAVCIC